MRKFVFVCAFMPMLFTQIEAQNGASGYPSEKIDVVLSKAESMLGVPYRYGTCSSSSTDCSGLIYLSFRAADIHLPRSSRGMYAMKRGRKLGKNDTYQKGDLLFFRSGGRAVGHVGMVAEIRDGRVRFIHNSTNNGKVAIDYLDDEVYWNIFVGGRRLFQNLDEADALVRKPERAIDFAPAKKREKRLTKSDIKDLTPCEIRLLKNTIFARHGYAFHLNPEVQAYFESLEWYRKISPKTKNAGEVERRFSETDRANVQFLQQYEGSCDDWYSEETAAETSENLLSRLNIHFPDIREMLNGR
ncbi:MAG: YARHG domain-containing protein [Bacteroidetes bacterium]|nr:MAG: YARHG domain-containing protein [Bacteroidota bacterium]